MKAIWEGAISFGLVNIPVKLYQAIRPKGVKFRYLHKACKTPIEERRYCPSCDAYIDWEDVALGYEYERERFVVLEEEDLQKIPLRTAKTIDVLAFVRLEEIDPILYEKPYYVVPKEEGLKAYHLLKEAMGLANRVAIGKVALRKKERLVALRPYRSVLLMETMIYPDEVRGLESFDLAGVPLREEEIRLAVDLINALTKPFEPSAYKDEYREALMELIQAKLKGVEVEVKAEGEKVKSLLEALKASVEMVRAKS